MRILLTGPIGQLGYELERSLQARGEVLALPRARLDLNDLDQVRATVRALRPTLIVNAAAYTAVDQAEAAPALAYRINADAPAVLAEEARALGAAMVHFSTDYVFDGAKPGPYVETDRPHPLNVYGQSKLAGEQAVAAAGIAHLIVRTSWLYGMRGQNFLQTMLRLGRAGGPLRVVADQQGAPTWCRTVADTTAQMLALAAAGGHPWWEANSGLYHLACQGQTSWHGFAEAIFAHSNIACAPQAIARAAYPQAAQRPAHSVLNCDKLIGRFGPIPAWDKALALCLA
ncbi:dTDP-4-dehydrorhamnose reductase [Massilia sp. CF038]|uniref:dTDP-4-dehydrorhamnose reductase n=1 Tax=Massilia sp. CF038 TaxID=1881045 RepID=UPI000919061B|nr:dTDP-4-dehydrorhamnose reductase [Massilia sp. CF038]SHG36970.1 dTDP-4-dehydrorhamnose reductase [Massilia sp. CF038]